MMVWRVMVVLLFGVTFLPLDRMTVKRKLRGWFISSKDQQAKRSAKCVTVY